MLCHPHELKRRESRAIYRKGHEFYQLNQLISILIFPFNLVLTYLKQPKEQVQRQTFASQ